MIGRKAKEEWYRALMRLGKGSAISQVSRRFKETIKGNKEFRGNPWQDQGGGLVECCDLPPLP